MVVLTEKGKMKKFLIFVLAALLLCSCSLDDSYADLGTPTLERSGEDGISRCPWDMIFYDGALYIGGGDYDRNMGPVDIWRYDESEGKWSLDATLPEEEISNFVLLGGASLAAPGIDPTDDGRLGAYHVRGETEWQTYKEIPEAFHTFDLADMTALFLSLAEWLRGPSRCSVKAIADGSACPLQKRE